MKISKLLPLTFAMSAIISGTALADTNDWNLPTNYKEAIVSISDTSTKYTTADVNVRISPNTDSEVAVVLGKNSAVDAIVDIDGWTLILGSDGNYYFIKSEYLSDTVTKPSYSDDDLYVLAHIIDAEMGVESWEDKIITGSVVLNRVTSKHFPNTIRKVVFQKGQYSPTWNGTFYNEPCSASWEAAKYLLENGSQIPSNVVYQAEFKQGKIWKKTKAAYYCYE